MEEIRSKRKEIMQLLVLVLAGLLQDGVRQGNFTRHKHFLRPVTTKREVPH